MAKAPKPPITLRLQVLAAVDYAPGSTIRERIQQVATRTFSDTERGIDYRFTWRTISTWLYRFKKHGITTLDNATRADRGLPRKVSVPNWPRPSARCCPRCPPTSRASCRTRCCIDGCSRKDSSPAASWRRPPSIGACASIVCSTIPTPASKRMGEAHLLDPVRNATTSRQLALLP